MLRQATSAGSESLSFARPPTEQLCPSKCRGTMNPVEMSPGTTSGYIPGLDGIRALAVFFVIFEHSVIHGEYIRYSGIGLHAGRTGVDLFFVLSGYLITTLLLREETRTGTISLRHFYIRRALRLFPALWLYLLVVGTLTAGGWLPHNPWHSFVSSFLYVRNIVGRGYETDHLWSLSIEEQFYLLWPLVVIALPRRNVARLVIGLGAIAAITSWRVYATKYGLASDGALCIRSDFRFDSPLIGCVLALIYAIFPDCVRRANGTSLRSDVLTVLGLAMLAGWIFFRPENSIVPGTLDTWACLIGVILVLSQTGRAGYISGCLTWAPLVYTGRISYGVYLWQMLFVGPPTPGFETIRSLPLGILLTFTVAIVSYTYLETPILRLKDRYGYGTSVTKLRPQVQH